MSASVLDLAIRGINLGAFFDVTVWLLSGVVSPERLKFELELPAVALTL